MSLKGPNPQHNDGSGLRVAIVHARWNATVIEPLVAGARKKLLEAGVKEENIVTQSCPGSWELPIAVQRLISASTIQSNATGAPSATDLLASSTADLSVTSTASGPFDAIIAVGVLIKGETMHFEYIAEAAVHGLMRAQLDTGIPVILGILTVLNEDQAKARAGIDGKGHNHGEDWGSAAVEMGVKRQEWASGKIEG
ncbi:6,7-dimethyl-8-ribityllumazine synthase [Emericellopsis atlantica]|uniref:6,7-dimethyl-8-ribityllumazine synthase n=1 Tax=Emericellopsis atlantica TaxID=2614577 RepID=A0A9P7ZL95_9HYPO|nr:6,7-dimethyl-8-ribityllumazine synthase [Emericellopsis atlantica]KAG9253670.1 6,7-dimethyl-8-ribityllumazine synthase [Emericellopsis atlantica]